MTDSFPRVLAIQAVVTNDNQILLATPSKQPDQGSLELIAGYWQPGERLTQAVTRHLQEKAGISADNIASIDFTGHYYDDPDRHPGQHCIPFVFRVTLHDPTQIPGGESQVAWYTPEQLTQATFALDNRQTLIDLQLLAE